MIPAELTALPQWVNHRNKVPVNPNTGTAASSTDSATWASYAEAQAGVAKWGCDGIGFVLQPPYIGIDLDDVVENGVIQDSAQSVIDSLRSYTEFSPSNTGVHIIVKGELPLGSLKQNGVEVYNTARYFTVTGRQVPLTVPMIRQADVSFLYPEERKGAGLKPKAAPITERLAAVSEGNRNNMFLSLAGSLRTSGKLDNITIFELLKPKAKEVAFDESELWHICNKYPDVGPIANTSDDEDDFAAFMADRRAKQWLCKPFITKEALGFFVGLPEALKTWGAMDLALECTQGGMWLGKHEVKPGKVFFIDQERTKDETQNRFAALLKQKGLKAEDVRGKLVVKCGTTFRLDHQQSFEGLKRKLDMLEPSLLVWDSWRTACSGDDTSSATVQAVIERAKEIRARYGCALLFIDHENKNTFQVIRDKEAPNYGNQNGSIAKPAAAEFTLTFRKDDSGGSWVYHTKCTQGKAHAPFLMRVKDTTPIEGESIIVEAQ